MKRELTSNYDTYSVNTLCTADGPSRFTCHRFHSARPLDPIRMYFDFMERMYRNDLFHRVWSDATRKASHRKDELTIQDIVDEIWRPAFKECEETILEGLRNESIMLQAVDSYFKCYDSIETIESHLYRLFSGVELCHGRHPPPTCPKWIHEAVDRIHYYWTLSDYAAAAETILDLKDKLKLTGDFHVISTIAKKVGIVSLWSCMIVTLAIIILHIQVSASMQDQSLSAVSDSLVEAGEFLREIQRDKKKLDCLHAFASSLDFVEWLRKETKGIFG